MITIGVGDRGNSAHTVNDFISANGVSYWISLHHPVYLEMTIFKNTQQGILLSAMINHSATEKELEEYLFGEAIKRVSAKKLWNLIDRARRDCILEGRIEMQEEIRKVLGID